YTALKNGYKEIPLDVQPIIFDDRTYLPLRAVAEAMNADVNWNGNTRTVEIWK
ncbi:MAG: copper amine oxidase N-terminal domain-containing protein, partial [Clostridia bacterium]|nr:copper amine oxidase N-terminal domain-containing protein [Clostridia bacterium]